MATSMLSAAIRNNALWCDAVCRGHDSPGEFSSTLWFHRSGTPPFYPDVVTLTEAETAPEQEEAIAALVRADDRTWAVKDSYAALDLQALGFEILFEAEWLGIRSRPAATGSLSWQRIGDDAGLRDWESDWAKTNPPGTPRIFTERLLQDADIAFLLARRSGGLLGGGILHRDAGVVGLSNIFAVEREQDAVRRGLLSQAAELFPRLPVVGYEHGDALEAALALGFGSLGPLRVWVRER